jgi:hypothetical protein
MAAHVLEPMPEDPIQLEVSRLRAQAERCRRLARSTSDRTAMVALKEFAIECDALADQLEAATLDQAKPEDA